MKDVRRLADRIAQLAASDRAPPGGRRLAPGPDGAPLAPILREIDETVLPKSLVFRRGDAMLTLSAANRRMISLDAAEGPGAKPAQAILGRALTQPDVALLGKLRDALTSGLPGKAPIMVVATAPDKNSADFAAGTTAAALASAWGVDLAPAPSPETDPLSELDAFMATAPSLARAWMRLASGIMTEAGGDKALVALLKDFADSADMADLDMAPGAEGHRFVAIGRAPDDGDCLLFVSDRTDAALLLIPAEALDDAKKTWRKAVR